jgi:hypothetical protein
LPCIHHVASFGKTVTFSIHSELNAVPLLLQHFISPLLFLSPPICVWTCSCCPFSSNTSSHRSCSSAPLTSSLCLDWLLLPLLLHHLLLPPCSSHLLLVFRLAPATPAPPSPPPTTPAPLLLSPLLLLCSTHLLLVFRLPPATPAPPPPPLTTPAPLLHSPPPCV